MSIRIKFRKLAPCQEVLEALVKENLINTTLEEPVELPTSISQLKPYTYLLYYVDDEIAGIGWITEKLHFHGALYRKFFGQGRLVIETLINYILPNDKCFSGKTLFITPIPKARHARKLCRDLGFQTISKDSNTYEIKVK